MSDFRHYRRRRLATGHDAASSRHAAHSCATISARARKYTIAAKRPPIYKQEHIIRQESPRSHGGRARRAGDMAKIYRFEMMPGHGLGRDDA